MIYAPVLIPTCNRYEHFKQCIESLAKCTWAEYTDVFVAVDYPAKEEHKPGYNQIKDYLDCCGDFHFHSLNVIYRETNYYYSGKGNLETLMNDVLESYDRMIISEDDNIFSPNFLVFMDRGLEKFEGDSSVFALNGYRHFYPVKFDNNSFFRQNVDFSAWGFGVLRNQWKKYVEQINPQYFKNKITIHNIIKLKRNGNNRLRDFIKSSRSKIIQRYDDQLSVMMALENIDVVMPKVSLVRNIGWDGSGFHCHTTDASLINNHLNQSISTDDDFLFLGSGMEHYAENKRIFVENSYGNFSIIDYLKRKIFN